jgi:hypothetical protein
MEEIRCIVVLMIAIIDIFEVSVSNSFISDDEIAPTATVIFGKVLT